MTLYGAVANRKREAQVSASFSRSYTSLLRAITTVERFATGNTIILNTSRKFTYGETDNPFTKPNPRMHPLQNVNKA